MIDEKTLEEILQLKKDRNNLLVVHNYYSYHSNGGYCALETSHGEYVAIPADAFLGFLLEQISNVDKQLISLGFQPSPLDLKEGEKK